jgi:CHAD domain-containing protein
VAVEVVLRQRLTAVSRALPAARAGEVGAVHQARVASRRLREALPLVKGAAGRKLGRTTRRLTRALGPVRELDVTLSILDALEANEQVSRSAAALLRHAVREERQSLHDGVVREIDRWESGKPGKKALAAAREQAAAPGAAVPPVSRIDAARKRAVRRSHRLRRAIDTAAGIYVPERLHDVRIAVKKLRYAMEVVRELSRSRATARIRALKRVQDLLGRMHDLEMLIARTRAVQGAPNAPTLRVSADLDGLVRRLEMECRQLHGQYMAARSTLLAICDHVEADAAPRRTAAA